MVQPYGIQAPEDIAKEFGGNKQKIMAAAQAGVLDPTAAVMAGMFIDRMRAAAQQEAAPAPTTVAQDTFTPPMPQGGGIGAMPQAAPPMPAQMGPQGVPPQGGGIGGLDFAAAPMAEGGVVGYAEGGLTESQYTQAIETGVIPANASEEDRANIRATLQDIARLYLL